MKYRYIAIIAILIIAVVGGATYLLSQPSLGYWSWHFPAGEWVEVTFTQEVFNCEGTDAPEDIFGPLIPVADEIFVFQEQDGELVSWGSTLDPIYVTLHHILPNVPCSVQCESSCTLLIMKC